MTLEDLAELKRLDDLPFPVRSKSKIRGFLNVNHFVVLPIANYSSYYNTDTDISIYDELNNEVGVLCFTKDLGETNWRELTEYQFIAFLSEANYATREDPFTFENNYILIKDAFLGEYLEKFEKTAPIWGGFSHLDQQEILTQKITVQRIDLAAISLPNNLFLENAKRSVLQPFAHERFLKLYHLLELRFDSDIVQEIQALDLEVNPEKIGEIFNDYSRYDEFDRLKRIIQSNCNGIGKLVGCLNLLNGYQPLASNILFKFGKKGSNPIDDEAKFRDVCPHGFSEQQLRAHRIGFHDYNKFITHFSAYCIYRVRCSVAHSRIGEYIMSHGDETFIVDFAEPLLKEIIKQCFKA